MRSEKEIKQMLEKIFEVEAERGRFKLNQMSPRNYAKIVALEWVLESREELIRIYNCVTHKLIRKKSKIIPCGLSSLQHLRSI